MNGTFLNIGCGKKKFPGFINIDLDDDADLQADVRQGLPFPDNSVAGIFSEHFIEHLTQREAIRFLRECRRVLAPEGRLRLATPDLDAIVERYQRDWRGQAWLDDFGYGWVDNRCEVLNIALREWGHRWLFNEEELVRLGRLAGLHFKARCALGESTEPMLRGREWRGESGLIVEFDKEISAAPNGEPLVSVLIPAYNPRYLVECLESALAQSYSQIEIILCDDSCGDQISAIVAPYASRDTRIRYVKNEKNLLAYGNYLKCFSLAQGEFVKFLNDDDLLHPSCIERMVEAFLAYPRVTLVTSRRQCIDAEGRDLPDFLPTRPIVAEDCLLKGESLANALLGSQLNFIGEPTTVMFRRRDLAGTRPDILSFAGRPSTYNADVAMWLNLLSKGDAIYFIEPLSSFRRHAEQEQCQDHSVRLGTQAWQEMRSDGARMGLFEPDRPLELHARPLRSLSSAAAAGNLWGPNFPSVADKTACATPPSGRPGETGTQQLEQLVSQGEDLFAAGDLEGASACFRKVVEHDPFHVEAIGNLGVVAFHAGLPEEALAFFRRALEINPSYAQALESIVPCLEDLSRPEEAEDCARRLAEVKREGARLLAQGEEAFAAGELESARASFERIVQADPGHAEALNNLGVIAFHEGCVEAARKLFEKVLAIDETFPEAGVNLAKCQPAPEKKKPATQSRTSFSIVTCSIDESKFARLKASVAKAFSSPVQLIRIANAKSLSEGYNRGAREAAGEIVIFCHDDIEFLNDDLERLLAEDLETSDIVGVAGTTRLVEGNWVAAGQPHIHGQVAHSLPDRPDRYNLCLYGLGRDSTLVTGIQALDGLFFAVRRSVLETVRFDAATFDGFHLYDLDFTFSAFRQGFRLSVDHRLHLLHGSGGNYDQSWEKFAGRFNRKHASALAAGEKGPVRFYKTLGAHSLEEVKREMARHAEPRQVELFGPGEEDFQPERGLPLAADSVDYLRVNVRPGAIEDRIALMNEAHRVCRHGAMVEFSHTLQAKERNAAPWQLHHYFAFDLKCPGFFRLARQRGLKGAFLLQHPPVRTDQKGAALQAFYQVHKDESQVGAVLAEQSKVRRETPIRSSGQAPWRGERSGTPRFSIIIPHYQGSISHELFCRGIASLLEQSFRDFEILCFHDGPLLEPQRDFPVPVFPTARRYNDWGHSLRDIGIHEARGEYILHFNPDNVLYPGALEQLSQGRKDILIFPVKMIGMERNGERIFYSKPRDYSKHVVLPGRPVAFNNIDCMQLVMKRQRWLEAGGWFDKRETSDGFLYPLFAEEYEVEHLGEEPLGEHW